MKSENKTLDVNDSTLTIYIIRGKEIEEVNEKNIKKLFKYEPEKNTITNGWELKKYNQE